MTDIKLFMFGIEEHTHLKNNSIKFLSAYRFLFQSNFYTFFLYLWQLGQAGEKVFAITNRQV